MSNSQERFFDLLIDTIFAKVAEGKKKEAAAIFILGAKLAEVTLSRQQQ